MTKEETGSVKVSKGTLLAIGKQLGIALVIATASGAASLWGVQQAAPNQTQVHESVDAIKGVSDDIRRMREDVTRMSAALDLITKSIANDKAELERRIDKMERDNERTAAFKTETEKRLAKLEAEKK